MALFTQRVGEHAFLELRALLFVLLGTSCSIAHNPSSESGRMQPLAIDLGEAYESRSQQRKQRTMPFANERIERKDRLLAQLDPDHKVKLEGTFINHLAAAVRASSPSERQKALDKATEAYESALDDVLHEDGGIEGSE